MDLIKKESFFNGEDLHIGYSLEKTECWKENRDQRLLNTYEEMYFGEFKIKFYTILKHLVITKDCMS